MFCHQCGEKVVKESKFCSSCGAEVQATKAARKEEPKGKESSITASILPVIIPILSVIIVGIGVAAYYFLETDVNSDTLKLKVSAEEMALKGDFKKAKELAENGLAKRPGYQALQADLEVIDKALKYETALLTISDHIKKTNFDAASKGLATLKEELNKSESPIFDNLIKLANEKQIKITVGTIKKELNGLKTIDELGGKLSILSSMPENEASAVKTEILNKIVQISSQEAEGELASKNFSQAFSDIDKGLQFAVNDKKLLALKERVQQDQTAFEKAEQQRIEKAMEAAAQEDLRNKTAAVQVLEVTAQLDEYGDLYISGNVENVATTTISSVTVNYTIYDTEGNYINSGYASVYPYYLEPGETGYFEDIQYGVYQEANVEIDNSTWYVD